ncbi:hypothetical protein ACFQV2_14530 [Actinokineospora soli]|uniref:Uncharacterized protein n=1 Tax=Actinokineospora soli TaxID=1048753 RepID=A0ABW2TNF9_9PSEU
MGRPAVHRAGAAQPRPQRGDLGAARDGGDPRYPASQRLPDFPYASYAEMLGLTGIRLDHAGAVQSTWRKAFNATRPVVVEALVDPAVPLLAPHLPDDAARKLYRGLDQEPDGSRARERVFAQRAEEGHDDHALRS